jgi:hypothetical protein
MIGWAVAFGDGGAAEHELIAFFNAVVTRR